MDEFDAHQRRERRRQGGHLRACGCQHVQPGSGCPGGTPASRTRRRRRKLLQLPRRHRLRRPRKWIPTPTIDDLVPDRFPRALTAAETAAVPTMLEDASFLLSTKVPGLQAAVDGGDEAVTYAAMLLVVTMVKRSLLASAAQQTANPRRRPGEPAVRAVQQHGQVQDRRAATCGCTTTSWSLCWRCYAGTPVAVSMQVTGILVEALKTSGTRSTTAR